MRGKKTVINTAMNLLEELISVICGFILPRLILTEFGSQYNGLTTSITQFLACAVLLRAGIGGATRAALYKPLAQKNKLEIDAIMKATDVFMRKIGLILGAGIIGFAVIYPCFMLDEFDWFFSFSLFLIIGASTFAESFFGITYLILLQADQRLWVSSLMKSICLILNALLAVVLIRTVDSIHIVKLGSSLIFVLYPIVLRWYVKKRYAIRSDVKPNNTAIAQRWDSFWHQVATFIVSNTSVIVLTMFSNMLEVSVYSAYMLVVNGIKKLVFSFSNGLEAAFGNMIANKEQQALRENLSLIEWVLYTVSTIVVACALVMIVPFIRIYTAGVNDVNYIRPVLACLLLAAVLFNCLRLPYQLIVQAAGHYRQTRNGAILEAVINATSSIVLCIFLGSVGVAIGTLVATVFRTAQFSVYAGRHIVKRNIAVVILRVSITLAEVGVVWLVMQALPLPQPSNYFDWMLNALVALAVTCVVVGAGSIGFYRKDMQLFSRKVKAVFKKTAKASA